MEDEKSLVKPVLIGLVAAGLIYSKYHGGILILFTLLARPKTLFNWRIYLSGILAFFLIIPHLYWQYENDWVSFNYHLFERNIKSGGILNTLEFLGVSIVVLNPILLGYTIYVYVKNKNTFNSTSSYLIRLTFILFFFFLLYSFKGKIEAHWVAILCLPLLLFLGNLLTQNKLKVKPLQLVIGSSWILILLARGITFLPIENNTELFRNNEKRFTVIKEKSEGLPVIFTNSYTQASLYHFYTGDQSFSWNNSYYRKNHFDNIRYARLFNGKKVFHIANHITSDTPIYLGVKDSIYAHVIPHLKVLALLEATETQEKRISMHHEEIKLKLAITNPYPYPVHFKDSVSPIAIKLGLYSSKKIETISTNYKGPEILPPKTTDTFKIRLKIPTEITGDFRYYDWELTQVPYYPISISRKHDLY